MRPDEHNLNSLRKLVRDLQEENKSLKKLLDENNIIYESENVFDDTGFSDEYDDEFHLEDVVGGELHVVLEDGVYVDTRLETIRL